MYKFHEDKIQLASSFTNKTQKATSSTNKNQHKKGSIGWISFTMWENNIQVSRREKTTRNKFHKEISARNKSYEQNSARNWFHV